MFIPEASCLLLLLPLHLTVPLSLFLSFFRYQFLSQLQKKTAPSPPSAQGLYSSRTVFLAASLHIMHPITPLHPHHHCIYVPPPPHIYASPSYIHTFIHHHPRGLFCLHRNSTLFLAHMEDDGVLTRFF